MADFNYSILRGLAPVTLPSCSLFAHTAATASYARSILIHNVSSSVQTCTLWLCTGSYSPMLDKDRFFQTSISGSSTFIIELGTPGMIMTQSGAQIWGTTTNDSGINIAIYGGVE